MLRMHLLKFTPQRNQKQNLDTLGLYFVCKVGQAFPFFILRLPYLYHEEEKRRLEFILGKLIEVADLVGLKTARIAAATEMTFIFRGD